LLDYPPEILYNQVNQLARFFDVLRVAMMDIENMDIGHIDIIKVAASSRTSAVAGAIAGVIREHDHADVQAIGASAVNQAVKALALAKGYLAEDGIEIVCVPHFVDVEIDGKLRTAIKFTVDPISHYLE
jgi:stage V sporulation protein S